MIIDEINSFNFLSHHHVVLTKRPIGHIDYLNKNSCFILFRNVDV